MCERCKGLFFCRPHYCPERELAMDALKRPEAVDGRLPPADPPEIEPVEIDALGLEAVAID